MKKAISALLLVFIMIAGMLPLSLSAEVGDLSATCTDYKISFEISGADVVFGEALPDDNNGFLDLVVTNVTDSLVITPIFTENTGDVLETIPENIVLDLSFGGASAEFEVVFADLSKPTGVWIVDVIAEDFSEEDSFEEEPVILDIRDKTIWTLFDYYARITNLGIRGAKVESFAENDMIIDIVLDGNCPADAEFTFEFGTMTNLAEISGHTGTVKLVDGKATKSVTITGKSTEISSWTDSVTYILNFSLGTPYTPFVERIEITKPPLNTEYIENEKFNPAGMEVTAYYSDGSSVVTENYICTPEDFLTTDDTMVTVTYTGDDCGLNTPSATVSIVVNEIHTDDGFFEEEEPQYNFVNVYMTFVDRGEIIAQNEEITIYDEDWDGIYCIGDAFRALHRDCYSGGESGYKEISGNGLLGWVAKFWGTSDTTFAYSLNHRWTNSTTAVIEEGDIIAAINGTDEMFYSDLYTWFEKNVYYVQKNTEIEFKVNGLNLMGSNATYDAIHPPVGANVSVYDENGEEISGMNTIVADGGNFSLNFQNDGIYTVKISGTARWGSYNEAPVAPSTCTVNVNSEDNYGGGFTEDEIFEETTDEMLNISSEKGIITISEEDIESAFKKAEQDNTDYLDISPKISENANKVEISLSDDYINKIAERGFGINVNTPVANIRLPQRAVTDLATKKGELILSASDDEDGKIQISISEGGKKEEKIDGGIRISFPDKNNGKIMVIVNEDGSEKIVARHIVTGGEHQAIISGSAVIRIIENHKTFTDVEGHWGEEAIGFVTERELFEGVGDGLFDTEEAMTRAMVVTVLYRLCGDEEVAFENKFNDVSNEDWYSKSVAWANAKGIVKGADDVSFEPDREITREQLATIIYRCALYLGVDDSKKSDLTQFKDYDKINYWAEDAVSWAVGAEIINGKPNEVLDSYDNATRTEVAAILQRFVIHILNNCN